MRKINILGEKYTIDNSKYLTGMDGNIDWTNKRIQIAKSLDEPNSSKLANLNLYKNSVTRHEIIHAMFQESGLDTFSNNIHNEETVDWIAKMYPKMVKIFSKLEIEE